MRVHFCGTRGSTPAPGAEFIRYGGHTSCVALLHDGDRERAAGPTLLLDAGTGIRRLPALLGDRPFTGTVLLSHLHWDHVQGLPFFGSGDREDAQVTLLLPGQEDGTEAESVLARMMSPPLFPVRPTDLRGKWTFGSVPAEALSQTGAAIEGFAVHAREIPHKGGRTFGYRVSDGHSSMAYLPDHCPTALGPGPDGWGDYHEAALDLASGVDLLVHDASLCAEEVATQAVFGHAAAEYAVELGRRAGAGRVLLFHHRPDRDDQAVDDIIKRFASAPVAVSGAADDLDLSL